MLILVLALVLAEETAAVAAAVAMAVAAACGMRHPHGPLRGLTVHSLSGLLLCSSFLYGSFPHFSSVDCSLTVPRLPDCSFIYGSFPCLTVLSLHTPHSGTTTRLHGCAQSACTLPTVNELMLIQRSLLCVIRRTFASWATAAPPLGKNCSINPQAPAYEPEPFATAIHIQESTQSKSLNGIKVTQQEN